MNMEYGGAAFTTPNSSTYGNFSSDHHHHTAIEMDFVDELLFEGCWLEITRALNDPSVPYYLPALDSNNIINHHQQIYQEDQTVVGVGFPESESILVEGAELGRRWWIGPRANPGPSSSVKKRLVLAVGYLRECTKNMNVLLQLWVPVRRGGGSRYFLNTGQDQVPYYRNVCRGYQLAVEEDIEESGGGGGLPGRVFMGNTTTPDVRFFKRDEYPRINYDVRGCLALPVFERGSGTCLGVVEIVTTNQKINYRPELEHVCQALEAVDLRSSQYFSPPGVKASHEELYQFALAEIIEVLASVCKTHRLPLALTWAPCYQQGKGGCRQYSDDQNYAQCVSTVNTACFVSDVNVFRFHEACSEHHLFRSQGTVGTAFTIAKPCFASDITAFSKAEYPLSQHARMVGLRAAVAIPLRSIYTGSADFVLEFFLPKDCQDPEEQKQMLNSLSIVLQQSCRSLHAVIDPKEEEEIIYPPVKEVVVNNKELEYQKTGLSSPLKDGSPKDQSSWIAHMMEAQQKGKGASISLEYQEEEANEEFKVTTHWDNINSTQGGSRNIGQAFSDFGQLQQSSGSKGSVEGGGDSYSYGSCRSSGGRKSGEKRRTNTEKTISLPVLRQYFTGSLKDAAESIGVCPTTLKRICRQHGITRWPSRKIKKVGHSLRKLQLVIDSVQGAEGAIQIGSFYSNFPELSSPGTSPFSSMKMAENSKQSNPIPDSSGLFTPSKSPPSSCSQTSGPSIFAANQHHTTTTINADTLMRENPGGILQMACSEADFHALNQQEANLLQRAMASGLDTTLPPVLPESSSHNSRESSTGGFRVKATFGDEKFRFSLHPNWTFRDLQLEIARRFNLDDVSRVDLKYLDDDREWVLLTCDADFQECIDIYRASQSHTIRLSLQHASNPNLGSPFGSSGLS